MSEITERVKELLKLPQELCKTCGKCCRIALFKGGLTYEQVLELSQRNPQSEEEAVQVDGARDFLTIFEPYESTAAARLFAPEFVDRTLVNFNKKDEDMTFFYCKYIGDNNLCMVHEDRPHLCRMYPIPHEKTLFNPGCGFEEKAKENWAEIQAIIRQLEELSRPLDVAGQKKVDPESLDVGAKDGNN